MASDLILTTAQAQAVYSAMCALNEIGVSSVYVVIPATATEHRINVYWNVEGVAVVFGSGSRENHDDQPAFAAAYGLPVAAPDLVAALRVAYSDIQRLPGHTIGMLGRIEAAIEQATA